MSGAWSVYILRCADDTLYTGITTDVARRTREHNTSKQRARYTKVRRPVSLVYEESAANRSQAAPREAQIKKLSRDDKLQLIASFSG